MNSSSQSLEFIETKSQHRGLKKNGKLVCSSINPVAEAKKWVNKHLDAFTKAESIVVLGIGCGYHLVELENKFEHKKILAIDTSEDIVAFAQTLQGLALSRTKLIHLTSCEDLFKNRIIAQSVRQRYVVASFGSVTHLDHANYQLMQDTLLGRNLQGFSFIIGQRTELKDRIKTLVPVKKVDQRNELLSIKDLANQLDSNYCGLETFIIKALRELVI